jgi:hypothetical protein
MAGSKKVAAIAAGAAVAVSSVVGIAVKSARSGGDDIVRVADDFARSADDIGRSGDDILRSSDDIVPNGAPAHPPPIGSAGQVVEDAAQVESRIASFADAVSDTGAATPEEAWDTGAGAACEVLRVAVFDGRLPTEFEWVKIGVGAMASAGIDDAYVPVGSAAWQYLEQAKDEVSGLISNQLGYADEEEAESLAEELACAWL